MVLLDQMIGQDDPFLCSHCLHFLAHPLGKVPDRLLFQVPVGCPEQAADRVVSGIEHELVPELQVDILGHHITDVGIFKELSDGFDPFAFAVVLLSKDYSSLFCIDDGVACVG
ncbi:hypothetical protein SDC9_85987 [bioreactor metagenome]|uniref:Uncharacterized protein n=1 Tax=bioreactor metagenome TaxID=1076179 RepID=A0A644ZNR1_9ZZZZ